MNAARCIAINAKINNTATKIFFLTLLIVLCNIPISLFGAPLYVTISLGLVATIAPVVAGSSRGIAIRSELGRLAITSNKVSMELESAIQRIDACQDGVSLRQEMLEAYRILVGSTENWKGLYRVSNITL